MIANPQLGRRGRRSTTRRLTCINFITPARIGVLPDSNTAEINDVVIFDGPRIVGVVGLTGNTSKHWVGGWRRIRGPMGYSRQVQAPPLVISVGLADKIDRSWLDGLVNEGIPVRLPDESTCKTRK